MKTLISENNGYRVYAEVRDALLAGDRNLFQLRFLSTLDKARNSDDARVLTEMILTSEELKELSYTLAHSVKV